MCSTSDTVNAQWRLACWCEPWDLCIQVSVAYWACSWQLHVDGGHPDRCTTLRSAKDLFLERSKKDRTWILDQSHIVAYLYCLNIIWYCILWSNIDIHVLRQMCTILWYIWLQKNMIRLIWLRITWFSFASGCCAKQFLLPLIHMSFLKPFCNATPRN